MMGAPDRPLASNDRKSASNKQVAVQGQNHTSVTAEEARRSSGNPTSVPGVRVDAAAATAAAAGTGSIRLVQYEDERQLSDIMSLVDRDLSEPYSIFTYRYFLHNWPGLCFVAKAGERTVGSIVCKAERELEADPLTGYIAMLAVDTEFRKHGIGSALASKAIEAMRDLGCEEVVLETEVTNRGALNLYTKLGFSKNERLIKYYLNGVDAFRLKLWFR